MRKYIFFILLLATCSCKNDLVKDVDKIEGTWYLKEMTYYHNDSIVEPQLETPSLLILGKRRGNGYESIPATQIIKSDTFKFTFIIGGSQIINLQMPRSVSDRLPVTGVGRVQGYRYHFISKNMLELSIDKEFNNQNNELYSDLTYLYQRK